jgi:UDP-glucose 4-epimerase
MPSKVTNMAAAYDTSMRAVVTGGAGFIGSHLVDALVARGDEVTVIDNLSSGKREHLNPGASFVERDIREGLDLAGADAVFHLAAQADVQTSVKRPDYDAEVNVLGTVNVVEAARAAGVQVVFSSTGGAIYGECVEPAREDSPLRPMSPYGIAKLCAEEYLLGWNRIHGSGHVVLRLANVYGPRQDAGLEGGVVSIFLERMERGEETTIFGDGLQERDFVYVGDVVSAMLAAVGRPGGIVNVGTGEATSVLDLHRACRSISGSPAEPIFAPARIGDVSRSVLDVSRAADELGWRAAVPLDEGLRRTWDWMTAM